MGKKESLLNIVDLAGSERRDKPYAEEDKNRAASPNASKDLRSRSNQKNRGTIADKTEIDMEGKFINKSLSTLGRVFSVLSNRNMKNVMPPYRECKLTRILQNSLTYEKCKCVMIVNISNRFENLQ